MAEIVLYKQADAWSLPSASSACIQVEAYLRFSGTQFHVKTCMTNSKSPTGQLPAIEKEAEIGGLEDSASNATPAGRGALGEFRAARLCIDFARRSGTDLDQHLSASQKAELLAYRVLMQTRLEAATTLSAWCEPLGFAEVRKVMGQLPFPLSYVIPWSQRREVQRQYANVDNAEVYAEAAAAIGALADRMRASSGAFFFGSRPSSLDALLVGHLIYYRFSPAAPPVLQEKVSNQTVLCEFVDFVMKEYFSTPALPAPSRQPQSQGEGMAGGWGSSTWSEAAKGQKAKEPKAEPTPAEKLFKRNSQLWLIGAGTALIAYVLLSGQYIRVADLGNSLLADDEDEGDDEGDDE